MPKSLSNWTKTIMSSNPSDGFIATCAVWLSAMVSYVTLDKMVMLFTLVFTGLQIYRSIMKIRDARSLSRRDFAVTQPDTL